MSSNFEIVPAHDLPLAAQAATFSEAFEGYVGGSFAMDAAGLGRSFVSRERIFVTAVSHVMRPVFAASATSRAPATLPGSLARRGAVRAQEPISQFHMRYHLSETNESDR